MGNVYVFSVSTTECARMLCISKTKNSILNSESWNININDVKLSCHGSNLALMYFDSIRCVKLINLVPVYLIEGKKNNLTSVKSRHIFILCLVI